MFREPDIVTTIEVRRIERTGRVVRIFDGRTVKNVILGKFDGSGQVGGPKLRRLDCIENGLKSMVSRD
jgi:hypothetical protein